MENCLHRLQNDPFTTHITKDSKNLRYVSPEEYQTLQSSNNIDSEKFDIVVDECL